ncbi:PA0061/PA0062 family lipoprotein [Pseudomonas defluvii]|uniref:PA0061/PA0062 family lipoprotein n=1 Tax=Pseudomonas defluvii TaxID=1876757 RepID=UPI00390601C0
MRQPLMLLTVSTLAACSNPLPPIDTKQAWVDLYTITPGRLVMADRLDGKRLNDGRYFQVTPGPHELIVRFDYEVYAGGFTSEPVERTCYLTVRYDNFQAGQRYRLEARAMSMTPNAWLYDAERKVLAEERDVHCIP